MTSMTARPPSRATLTVAEVAALLGISANAAYRAIAAGELPSLRLGRRIVVPVPRLMALLGAPPEQIPSDVPAWAKAGRA